MDLHIANHLAVNGHELGLDRSLLLLRAGVDGGTAQATAMLIGHRLINRLGLFLFVRSLCLGLAAHVAVTVEAEHKAAQCGQDGEQHQALGEPAREPGRHHAVPPGGAGGVEASSSRKP